MNPAARLSMALLFGLALWCPSLTSTLRGDMGLPEASIRYLAAFVFARVAIGSLAWLVQTYTGEVDPAVEGDAAAGDDAVTAPADVVGARRASDGVPSPAGAS